MLRPQERQVLERAKGAVIALGDDGLIGFASRDAQDLLAWDSRLVGQPLSAIIPQRLHGQMREGYETFVQSRGQQQRRGVHRHPARCGDGTERAVQINVQAFRRPDGSMFVCSVIANDEAPTPDLHAVATMLGQHGYRVL